MLIEKPEYHQQVQLQLKGYNARDEEHFYRDTMFQIFNRKARECLQTGLTDEVLERIGK